MSNLLDRIKAKNKKYDAVYLSERANTERTLIKTNTPGWNLMMSGKYFGGYYTGLSIFAAPSRHFKTGQLLFMLKAYLDQYPDASAVLYDSENGAAVKFFDAFDIPHDRVLIIPIMNIEELKFSCAKLLEDDVEKGDKLFIGIDSIGNLASKKEVEDAMKESGAADMTRAKQLKSFFRIVTPYLAKYDIPMVAVNHVYSSMDMYGDDIMGGGQGPLLSADTVIYLGKAKIKDDATKQVEGFNFTMRAYKSRTIREGAKLPLAITFDGGIDPISGLLELGLFTKTIEKQGIKYAPVLFDKETGEVIDNTEFALKKKELTVEWFDRIVNNPNCEFLTKVEQYFQLGGGGTKMVQGGIETRDSAPADEVDTSAFED